MRESQERVTAVIDGEDWGVFDGFSGGEADSEDSKHRPGGMGDEISLGGQKTIGNVTISRLYDLERDHGKVKPLMNRVGRARIVASRQPLDRDGFPVGEPDVYTGVVKSVTKPDHDSNSDDPALFEIEFTANGTIG